MPFYKRSYSPGELQFITTSTYRRAPLFLSERFCRCFVRRLERLRQEMKFLLIGWVLMPDHLHLLLKPEPAETTPLILKGLKEQTASRILKTLRENPRRFVRAFAPRNPVERTLVRAIDETAWRMLRAYHTRAAADAKMLKHLLNSAPRARALSAGDTLDLILKLELALGNDLKLMDSAGRIRRQLERLTGMLVRKRSRGKLDYRIITKEHKNDWANLLKYARKKKAARSR